MNQVLQKLRQEKKDAADTADPNSTPKDKDSPKTAEPSPLPSSTSGGPTLYLLRKGSKPEKLKMVEAYLSSISTSTAMGATTFIFKLSPDGEKIIFVNWTKSACKATTFSTSTQEKIWESDISQSVNSSNYYVASLVFSPDNQKIAFLGDTLPVIDLNTGKTISAYRWSEDKKLVAATFDSTSKKIIAILQKYEEGNDGRGNKWTRATNKVEMVEFDTSDGKILKTSNIEPPRSKYSGSAYQGNLRVSPNGMMFLIESSQFSMYPPGSLKPAYTISSYRTDSSSYSSSVQTVLNNNGKWLCGLEKKNLNAQNQNTNNSEYYLSVFNSATGEECIKWDCGKEAILGISFADDGRTIRTIDSNGGLKIYPAE